MRILFYVGSSERAMNLARTFKRGAEYNHETSIFEDIAAVNAANTGFDLVCTFENVGEQIEHGSLPILYFDKPYRRLVKSNADSGFFRVSLGARMPTEYVSRLDFGPERANLLGWKAPEQRRNGMKIMLALSDKDDVRACETVKQLRAVSDSPIVYRPRPNWDGAGAIPGVAISREKNIDDAFYAYDVRLLVTYDSGCCLDALFAGIPSIVLGNGITKTLSHNEISEFAVASPLFASKKVAQQFINNLAHFQYSIDEIGSRQFMERIVDLMGQVKIAGCPLNA